MWQPKWWESAPFKGLMKEWQPQKELVVLKERYTPLAEYFGRITEPCCRLLYEQMAWREIQTLCRIPQWVEEFTSDSTPERPIVKCTRLVCSTEAVEARGRCCAEHRSLQFEQVWHQREDGSLMCWVDGGEAVASRSCCETDRTEPTGWLNCVACGTTEHSRCWCAQRLEADSSDYSSSDEESDRWHHAYADRGWSWTEKWGGGWHDAGGNLEKLLLVLDTAQEAYFVPHLCVRCIDRPWDTMARLRSTLNGLEDWNRLFELVERQGPFGPAGFGLWLFCQGCEFMDKFTDRSSPNWNIKYAELKQAMAEPLKPAVGLYDLWGQPGKPLWGKGCEWWTTWSDYSQSNRKIRLVVAAMGSTPRFSLRDPVYRNCYVSQSVSEDEAGESEVESDKAETEGKSRRSRKTARTSMEREITTEHVGNRETHALLTVGSHGDMESVNKNFLHGLAPRVCRQEAGRGEESCIRHEGGDRLEDRKESNSRVRGERRGGGILSRPCQTEWGGPYKGRQNCGVMTRGGRRGGGILSRSCQTEWGDSHKWRRDGKEGVRRERRGGGILSV